jgi:L-lactate dehydrogenase complex protein LldG
VLGRVRRALGDIPPDEQPNDVSVPREYVRSTGLTPLETIERLVERLADYGADVRRCAAGAEARTVSAALAANGAARVGVPHDLPAAFRPTGVELVEDRALPTRGPDGLEGLDAVVTTCSLAIAETGTICLTGGVGDGRRALTLVPDLHLCVVRADQVVATVPEGLRRLRGAVDDGRPLTLVSGPSATSDIELERVEGVHGPRRLVVLVVR